ncbi:hypothetical protein L484_025646 [Morus notabilis]|uniref:Uncharacterized protein n=1 Tax=Morus notabilis TaxID=981085 RepID=W9RH04_9ROSA|nr:hypothetical protein L484_025646 [Morus notabilis]
MLVSVDPVELAPWSVVTLLVIAPTGNRNCPYRCRVKPTPNQNPTPHHTANPISQPLWEWDYALTFAHQPYIYIIPTKRWGFLELVLALHQHVY